MNGAPETSYQGDSILFLSCDLVGSTRYKELEPTSWAHAFLLFYRQFPQALAEARLEAGHAVEFQLWKAIGDELIFTCLVRHECDVANAIEIWLRAMHEYENQTLARSNLSTKGGAFIATFPGPDSRVSVPFRPETEISDADVIELNEIAWTQTEPGQYLYDYLGPSVDTGFQLLKEADRRFFVLSVEVVWAIGRNAIHEGTPQVPQLVTKEPKVLKGIWGGRPYPVCGTGTTTTTLMALCALSRTLRRLSQIDMLCKACSESEGWHTRAYLPESSFALSNTFLKTLRSPSSNGAETRSAPAAPRPDRRSPRSGTPSPWTDER